MPLQFRATVRAVLTASVLLFVGCTAPRDETQRTAADTATAPSAAPPTAAASPTTVVPTTSETADTAARAARTASDTLVDPAKVVPNARPRADLRMEVDLKARQLYVYQGQTRTATYPVAVGSAKWPTQTGEWVISQVVWNPEWIPPDESWADEGDRKAPGDPDNPLGRAQLIYDPPRTIHGTNTPASIGKAVSHGSIRMRNATITKLGRQVMEAAGVGKDDAWYRRAQENRSDKQIVDLPRVVPIRVF